MNARLFTEILSIRSAFICAHCYIQKISSGSFLNSMFKSSLTLCVKILEWFLVVAVGKHNLNIVWFQKISIPPPRRVFSSLTPHPTGFSVPEGFALLPLPPGISMIFFTWSLVAFGNSESKKKDLIYFDLLRAVIKIKFF